MVVVIVVLEVAVMADIADTQPASRGAIGISRKALKKRASLWEPGKGARIST
jgi:hypothetical protein